MVIFNLKGRDTEKNISCIVYFPISCSSLGWARLNKELGIQCRSPTWVAGSHARPRFCHRRNCITNTETKAKARQANMGCWHLNWELNYCAKCPSQVCFYKTSLSKSLLIIWELCTYQHIIKFAKNLQWLCCNQSCEKRIFYEFQC